MSPIHLEYLSEHFKILNRREGLSGAFRDLLSGDYRTVKAARLCLKNSEHLFLVLGAVHSKGNLSAIVK